jgi:hypothetical protein
MSREFLSQYSFSLSSRCPKPRWIPDLYHASFDMDDPDSFEDFYETPTIFQVSSLMDGPGPFMNSPFVILAGLLVVSPVPNTLKTLNPTGSMVHTHPDRWSGFDRDSRFRDFGRLFTLDLPVTKLPVASKSLPPFLQNGQS